MRSTWLKWAMSILAGVAALWGTVLAEDSAEIAGVVVDEAGDPIAGARFVVLMMDVSAIWQFEVAAETETNEEGRFSLTAANTAYSLYAAQHQDYGIVWTMGMALVQTGTDLSDLQLVLREGGSVQGTVTDSAGNPVEGAAVTPFITLPEGMVGDDLPFLPVCEALLKATSAADGSFVLEGLPASATVMLRVGHPDFEVVVKGAPENLMGKLRGEIAVGGEDVTVKLGPGAAIEGGVTFGETGQPAEGVIVTATAMPQPRDLTALVLGLQRTETDANGRYVLRGLGTATYLLKAAHPDGTAAPESIQVAAGDRLTDQDFVLREGVLVSGKFVYGETGEPVVDGMLIARPKAAIRGPTDFTRVGLGPGGTFSFRAPGGTEIVLEGFTPSGARAQLELTLVEGEDPTDLLLEIQAPVAARGKVVGPEGKGLAGARVRNVHGGGTAGVETAADGSFELPLPGEGVVGYRRALLEASHPDLAGYRGVVPLTREAAVNAEVVIGMKRVGVVRGRVVDENGNPIPSANVIAWLSPEGVETRDKSARTGEEGRYEFTDLAGGVTYRISSAAEGYGRDDLRDIAVEAGGELEVEDLLLRVADRVIEGTVVDEDDNPLEGAEVRGYGSATGIPRTQTDSEGHFRLENLVDEEIRVLANYRGPEGYVRGEAQVRPGDTDIEIVLLENPLDLSAEEREARRLVGKKSPELDVAEWVSGEETSLGALRGMTVVLAFWDHTSEKCADLVGSLNSLSSEYADKSVVIITVHGAGADALKRFISNNSIELHVALDKPAEGYRGTTFEKYRVRKVSAIFIIDAEGKVRYQDVPLAAVEEALKQLIDE